MSFSYVYLLVSESNPARHYIGLTDDLKDRLRRHNAGEVTHTAKHRPWTVQVAVAFNDRTKASRVRDIPQGPLWPSLCQTALLKPEANEPKPGLSRRSVAKPDR